MKTRGIVFALEWILANALVLLVLDDTYSFYFVPWVVWNVTFSIFLFKLFTSPEDDGEVWPVGALVGAFGFVLTAVKVDVGDDDGMPWNDMPFNGVPWNDVPWNVWLGCCICLFGFALVGISCNARGDAWRDAPPPPPRGSFSLPQGSILQGSILQGSFLQGSVSLPKEDVDVDIDSNERSELSKTEQREEEDRVGNPQGDFDDTFEVNESSELLQPQQRKKEDPRERRRQSIIASITADGPYNDGPYKIIRHPIYCGLLSEALGSAVAGGFKSWIAVVAFFAVTTAYVLQLTQEEDEFNRMSNGRYEEQFKRETKYRLVPFIF